MSEVVSNSEIVHGYALKIGFESDVFVSGALVNSYSKFERVEDARRLFDGMDERDVILWNVMLKAYMELGNEDEMYRLFSEFHRSGLLPDDLSVHCVFSGSSSNKFVEQVKAYSIKICSFESNLDDVILWNKTMAEYFRAGKYLMAIDCFLEMKRMNVDYDNVSFVVVLSAVMGMSDMIIGQQIHTTAAKLGFDYFTSLANNFISMYSKMGYLDCALRVFNNMKELDLISWNSVISSCVQSGFEAKSITLFLKLLSKGLRPDQFTLASVLKACSAISEGFHIGKQIHVHALKMGSGEDDLVSTALIDVYGKSGRMKEAELLFSRSDGFDLVSWNAMMAGYVTNQDGHKALNLFSTIQKSGEKSNQFTLTTALNTCSCLVAFQQGKQIHGYIIRLGFESDQCVSSGILDMYVKCGDVSGASLAFDSIREPDIVTWTTMISGCVENGEEDRFLGFYHRMMCLGVSPDEYSFATFIKACSCLTALEQGRQIHANAIKLECTSDQFVGTLFVDMYAKCGSIQVSYKLFKRMNVRNIASWNAMVVGLAQHGNGEEALNFFKQMRCQDIKPDSITFIGVLSACSHSGLVSEAYGYFHSMHSMYGIEPKIEHYSCLVDVLGRTGHVHQAKKLIESMPFEPSASMYRALLGGCKLHGDAETGEYVATRLLVLELFDSAAYVLLSNIYASANQWGKVNETRKMMKSRSIKKDPGYSWIDVKSKDHLFVVDDKSHPQASAIYDKLEELIQIIGEEGYTPDTDYVMYDVEEEEKGRSLYFHSERLAIAYGIISTPPLTTIRVIKNLHACGDCHNAIKYISKAVDHEIVLRDTNRYHCFRNGVCSCGDYW
ncbi:hypothetical protein GIB67_029984 [Kingdonia uniflora]|uniref:DYW domain-containing protein n=1 Tax=Kingdonia uniflora TaxID=39325 RepID=A0A7J7MXX9_9MAGN|nr:hypothetical protein GIB67_029984 [Kingdonia uniflora]